MKLRSVFASLGLVAAAAAPMLVGSTAGAADTVQLRVTNAYTYGAGHPFDYTFCLDGQPLASLSTTDTSAPVAVTVGSHELTVFDGLDAGCDGEAEDSATIDVPDVDAATLMYYWAQDDGDNAVVLPDDIACTQPGEARVVVRNAASTYSESPESISVTADSPGGSSTDLATDVTPGDQQASDQPAGTYTNVESTDADGGALTEGDPDLDAALGTVTFRTYYGGVDGPIGSYDTAVAISTCQEPTTTLPGAPTTTIATEAKQAEAAKPVAATPAYTG